MIIKSLVAFLLALFASSCIAQELFPNTEPASTIPKNAFVLKYSFNHFQETYGRDKYWLGITGMYGVTEKFTAMGTISASNHHLKQFPENILNYFVNHHTLRYKAFSFIPEGAHIYGKYRVLSFDSKEKHTRLTVYGEASKSFIAHDIAEPLLSDNSGMGGGIILTRLYHRIAFSLSPGFIHPFVYKQDTITFQSGNAFNLNLSLGYRLYPREYKSLNDFNVNVYCELINKMYSQASMKFNGKPYDFSVFQKEAPYNYLSLLSGKYSEARISVQFILNAKTRVDLGAAKPIYYISYAYFYPLLYVNLLKNFY